jgi:ABC-type transporter Mla maintaining outer membrane lipid asymmetry ATPase subunit MlaF
MPMMVETRELSKAFGDHVVLEGIDLATTLRGIEGVSQKGSDTQIGRRCMKPAIGGNEFTKAFKKNSGLSGVHVPGEYGTIFALLSSNGAGKTTIGNILKCRSSRKGDAS